MAGGALYRPAWGAGVLEPACDLYQLPLLPYERELIAAIGCSEEEYRAFAAEVIRKGRARPAAYDHIPDIEAIPIGVIISLVIGIVTSAIGMLLQPKVPKQQEQKQIQQQALADRAGRTRFNATYGFDGAQELAEYGSRIAVLFGRYQQAGGYTTGGLSVSPQLVWSRMFSYGGSQGFKGLYVVGEALAESDPNARGVLLGNAGLDSLAPERYAFYWRPEGGRVRSGDLLAGTRGEPASGDPQPHDDIALVPTITGSAQPGFAMASQPSNQTEFGCYGAIRNGTGYRVNWRPVSIPVQTVAGGTENGDYQHRLANERRKIAGSGSDSAELSTPDSYAMQGEGRGYSCCMGLVSHNGNGYSEPTEVDANVGDEVQYLISGRRFPLRDGMFGFGEGSGITTEDIVSALNGERQAADDALQIGELFIINRNVYQVVRREGGREGVYELEGPDVVVTLRCIEITSPTNRRLGIAGYLAVRDRDVTHEGGTNEYKMSNGWLGPSWYPLLKVAFGVVRNVRVCEATEIGIKSRVYNQANGLCNFQDAPTPNRLARFDYDNINLTGGTLTSYFERTSVFTIFLRPSGLDANGAPYEWQPLGEQFCITGSTPQDQFNFIRLKTLDAPGQFEFRLIPKSGTDVVRFSPPEAIYWRLNAQSGVEFGETYYTPYGRFRLTVVGDKVVAANLGYNPELGNAGEPDRYETQSTVSSAGHVEWLPRDQSVGRAQAYFYTLFGWAADAQNQERTTTVTLSSARKTLTMRIRAVSRYTDDAAYIGRFGTNWWWAEFDWTLVGSTGNWEVGNTIDHGMVWTNSNPYVRAWGSGPYYGGAVIRVSNVDIRTNLIPGTVARKFERFSGYMETSHYKEISKSCDTEPEHSITYVNEMVDNGYAVPEYYGMSTVGLALRSGRDLQRLDAMRMWLPNGVSCKRWLDDSFGPSNLFSDLTYFMLADQRAGAGALAKGALIKEDDFKRTARFLQENRIYFDGVLADAKNARDYLTSTAPLNLCDFVIANGQFSIVPALPCDDSGAINPANVPIAMMFSEGNILEGSLEITYLDAEERRDFRAIVTWREMEKDKLPASKSVLVRWKDDGQEYMPQEQIDMSMFCTSRHHATMVARYLLSLRRRIDHMVTFKTTPFGINLAPGNFIRLVTASTPYSSTRNGVVDPATGAVLAVTPLPDGAHKVMAYKPGSEAVEEVTMTVTNGIVADPALQGAVFSSLVPQVTQNVYRVESLELDEDGMVSVMASHYPTENGRSVIADDVLNESLFLYSE